MPRFSDQRTEQIYDTQFHRQLSSKVTISAHEVMRLLCASLSLQDVGVIGPIYNLKDGRYGLRAEGRWFVTFTWVEGLGATSLLLERLKGS